MKFELLFLDTVDPSLGRLDYASLSQQALMEMVIEGITDKEMICGDADEPKDIEEWESVEIEDGEVVEIDWKKKDLKGSIHLEWLPSSVKELAVSGNRLAGTLDWALPTSMKELNLSVNKFTNPTKDTSPWWVGPVPQFWGKPRTFSNPSSCFCHGADPIDGHRKVVGQDQYPALGEVQETAKLLPRGESSWWRDEGRHLLILCCFNPRDEISPHA